MNLSKSRDKIEKLYLKGLNATEITRILNRNLEEEEHFKKETIQKHIQRNLLNKKMEHNIKMLEQKEALKAVNYEAKKFMTDKSFVTKNKSIYKTKVNGDIILDKEVAPITTWDTPRRLNNESKIN